jgi:hypothetical protein
VGGQPTGDLYVGRGYPPTRHRVVEYGYGDILLDPLDTPGKFHDQGDAKRIVIRGQLRGHNNTALREANPAGLSATRGLAARRAYLVVSFTIN